MVSYIEFFWSNETDEALVLGPAAAEPAILSACTTDLYCCESSQNLSKSCCNSNDPKDFFDLGAASPSYPSTVLPTSTMPAILPETQTPTMFIGDRHSSSTTATDLGAGIGLGVPFGLGVVGGGLYMLRRHKQNSQDEDQEPKAAGGGLFTFLRRRQAGQNENEDHDQEHGDSRRERTSAGGLLGWMPWASRPKARRSQVEHELPEIAEPPPTYTFADIGQRMRHQHNEDIHEIG